MSDMTKYEHNGTYGVWDTDMLTDGKKKKKL